VATHATGFTRWYAETVHPKPVAKFIGGAFLFIAFIGLHILDSLHGLEYIKTELPGFYAWIVSPTVTAGLIVVCVAFMILGVWEMRQQRRESGGATQENTATQGDVVMATGAGSAIKGDHNTVATTVIGTQNTYTQAVERKPKAIVAHGASGFVMTNQGPRLYDVHLRLFKQLGSLDIKWEPVGMLPEGATVPVKHSLWTGHIEYVVSMEMALAETHEQYIVIGIVCRDERRKMWEGYGALAFDVVTKQWSSSGFDEMREIPEQTC